MVSIFLAQMLNDGHILVKGTPDRYRDFVYIDDVVDSMIKCLSCNINGNDVINIGTGVRSLVTDVVDLLIFNQNGKVDVNYSGNTAGDLQGIYANIDKMKNRLGAAPKVSLENGIKQMMVWAEKSKSN